MPALGGGFAMLKWISSFPGNPAQHGLPTVMGVVCLSDAATSAPLLLLDARAVTALRTGAVAAVAAQALAREGARTVGVIGCGLHGAWAARCLAAAGYGPGVCADPRPEAAAALAQELGWRAGTREEALACDVVCCVTPGFEPVVEAADLRPGAAPEHARRRRARARPRRASRPSRAARSSATSGRRPPTAGSSPARSRPARSPATTSPTSARCWPATRPGARTPAR